MTGSVDQRPSVTIVFLVYNRHEALRTSLLQMSASDYPADRIDVIVVDNASTDGSAGMVSKEFPDVQLIARTENIGASALNEGLAAAGGDYVLVLDDDCFLPLNGLSHAVAAAERAHADLVSFKVVSTHNPDHVFTEKHRMGLFMFWGCAFLMRRRVVEALGGYDPEIFLMVNELELMLRFFDEGFRHLYLPEVAAQHLKSGSSEWIEAPGYGLNLRNYAYVVAKLLARRDAVEAFVALLARVARDGVRTDRIALKALPDVVGGFVHGLRHRTPVRNLYLSRCYRQNFETLASPWWLTRPPAELLGALSREILGQRVQRGSTEGPPGRRQRYFDERVAFYPDRATVLEFSPGPRIWSIAAS